MIRNCKCGHAYEVHFAFPNSTGFGQQPWGLGAYGGDAKNCNECECDNFIEKDNLEFLEDKSKEKEK